MIYAGGREVKEAWLGGVELAEIWLGSRLVWSGKYIRAKISAVLTLNGKCALVTADAVPASPAGKSMTFTLWALKKSERDGKETAP